MTSAGMLFAGAAVNALAFSGSNYLFGMLRSSGVEEERKRHDKAIEQLQAAHAAWSQRRSERLDWLNEEHRRQDHAVKTFHDADESMREYARVSGSSVDPHEPRLEDFYTPSEGQKDREITFIVLGMAASGLVVYGLSRLL